MKWESRNRVGIALRRGGGGGSVDCYQDFDELLLRREREKPENFKILSLAHPLRRFEAETSREGSALRPDKSAQHLKPDLWPNRNFITLRFFHFKGS
jgi:hypothetical protein